MSGVAQYITPALSLAGGALTGDPMLMAGGGMGLAGAIKGGKLGQLLGVGGDLGAYGIPGINMNSAGALGYNMLPNGLSGLFGGGAAPSRDGGGGAPTGGVGLPSGFSPTPGGAPPSIAQAMQQNPALAGINPNMVAAMSGGPAGGASPQMGGQQGGMMQQTMAALGPVGQSYMQYLQEKKLQQMRNYGPGAQMHSTPMSAIPGLSMAPPMGGFALPRIG